MQNHLSKKLERLERKLAELDAFMLGEDIEAKLRKNLETAKSQGMQTRRLK
jgi:hypothetical protein